MGPIDSVTAETVRREIATALSDRSRAVMVEIQDGGEFLLVRVQIPSRDSEDITYSIIKIASAVLNELISPRSGDYAWMVNVEYRDALLDSEVGGRS